MAADHPLPDDVVAAAVDGEAGAREVIVRAVGPLVLGLCRRLADDPDDAFQQVWERVFRSLGRFDPAGPARLSTWIATIAHRTLIDEHRGRRRRGEVIPFESAVDREPNPEESLATKERKTRLEDAIRELPPELGRVVLGHHLGGVPLADLANEEGVPTGTLKSRLHRARALLAVQLRGRK